MRERVALRRSKGPVGQERAARDALEGLRRRRAASSRRCAAEGEPSAQVVAALRDTARAYRALADAAHRRSRRAWTRARTAVSRAETHVEDPRRRDLSLRERQRSSTSG